MRNPTDCTTQIQIPVGPFPAIIVSILVSLFPCHSLLSQVKVPRTEAEVPIFPGASRDKAAEAKIMQQKMQEMSNLGQQHHPSRGGSDGRSPSLKVYTTNAPIEQVFKFCHERLGGKTEYGQEMDAESLKPGETTPVVYQISFQEFLVAGEVEEQFSPEKQALVAKVRKPYEPDKWIENAGFWWKGRDTKGDVTGFRIDINDIGFSADGKRYSPKTEIVISTEPQMSGEEAVDKAMREKEAQQDRQEQLDADEAAKLKSAPPTGNDLGVPIYPGSKFDAENSAGMSSDEEQYFIYLSNDPPQKALSFYESKTGKKGAEMEKGKYLIVVKGRAPFPELGVSIEPNAMFGGSAKTVITIRKKMADREQ